MALFLSRFRKRVALIVAQVGNGYPTKNTDTNKGGLWIEWPSRLHPHPSLRDSSSFDDTTTTKMQMFKQTVYMHGKPQGLIGTKSNPPLRSSPPPNPHTQIKTLRSNLCILGFLTDGYTGTGLWAFKTEDLFTWVTVLTVALSFVWMFFWNYNGDTLDGAYWCVLIRVSLIGCMRWF